MADLRTPETETPESAGSFRALLITQFQGAFSDNAFKTLVSFLVVQGQLQEHGKGLVLLVGALFAIPFLLFSMTGGFLADRYSKRSVTIGTKWMEIGVMVLALAGLAAGNVALQLTAVFLMSVQSALFSPSKYGLLPELLPESRLSWGNGVLNLATFMAIISGIVTGGLLAEAFGEAQHWSGLTLVALAVVGLLAATRIQLLPPADPARAFEVNFIREIVDQLRMVARNRLLNLAVLGNGYFYFLASFLQFNILFYGLEVLQIGETRNSVLMAAVALGIGAGSLLAGLLSGDRIEYGLVPFGGLGMSLAAALLAAPQLPYLAVALVLAGLGCFGGFFSVPVAALVQHLPDPQEKGRVLAATNIVCFLGVALASGVYYAFVLAGLDPAGIFLVAGAMTLVATILGVWLQPDSLPRMLQWLRGRVSSSV